VRSGVLSLEEACRRYNQSSLATLDRSLRCSGPARHSAPDLSRHGRATRSDIVAPTLSAATGYLAAMFGFGTAVGQYRSATSYLTPDVIFCLSTALLFAFVPVRPLSWLRFDRPAVMAPQLALSAASLAYSLLLLAANSFNPFITSASNAIMRPAARPHLQQVYSETRNIRSI
jgi:hypothetical protein